MTARRFFLFASLAAACLLGWASWTGRLAVPPRLNPWAPLDIDETPGPLTRYKLMRLADQPPAACLAWLDAAEVRHAPLADRRTAEGCCWQGATQVSALRSLRLSSPAPLACPAVAALALWERHGLQAAARVHLKSRVVGIDHLGSYACRDIAGGLVSRRSEHAFANAFDVAAFRLADGRRISVLKDWQADSQRQSPAALFLLDAEKSACPFFSAVLGPAYNAAHRDHFHLDRGRYSICS